jgi:plasmid stabilization system protein ParE
MAKEVILTPIALEDFDNVVNYLTNEWGISVSNKFVDRFVEVTGLIGRNPGLFPFVELHKRMQRCVVTKHNVIYFTETEDIIKILTVFDTRQDPSKLNTIF